MVWGLVDPGNFGDYFLNGKYTGWREKLADIFENEMSAEQRNNYNDDSSEYILSVVRKFKKNAGKIKNYEIPSEYRLIERCKSPASMVKIGSGLIAVDIDLKNIIEDTEPKIHKFAHIRLLDQKGSDFSKPYYAMIIQSFLRAFIPERSNDYRREGKNELYEALSDTKRSYNKIFISPEVRCHHHIWRDTKLFNPSIFISDDLQGKISERNLRIFRHHKMKVN